MEAPLQEDSGAPMFLTELMKKVLLFFLSGAFWSMIGLLFAALMNSRYMAYASPFILYYVLIILCERYFSSFYIIYPKEWTAPSSMWICGMSGVVVLLVGLIIFLSHIFNIIAKGRLNQI